MRVASLNVGIIIGFLPTSAIRLNDDFDRQHDVRL